jgi:predicted pyridoxine 5'-phosphate oxidase superfamily flavin-nucleotide-binding protein
VNKPASDPDFHPGELTAQQRWETEGEWVRERRQQLLWDHIPADLQERFASAPYFFLATSDGEGHCDCSFKGGGEGLIRLLDERRFAFPDFGGNGAFMSLGNILENPHVGCLFIDFNDGARLRVNGRASIFDDGETMALFPDAERVVVVDIEQVVPNCSQHIPRLIPASDSATH